MVEAPASATAEDGAEDLVASTAAGPVALRGGAIRGVSYAATVGLSLISIPLLIRHLGIAGFGRYSTVVALVAIIAGVTDAGLMNVALREWATRSGGDRAGIVRSLLGIRIELSVVGVAAGVAFAAAVGYRSVLVLGTLIAGIGWVFQALAHMYSVPLQGELRFGWVSLIDLCRQAAAVALIVVLVLAGSGLVPFFAVMIPSGLIMLAVAIALVRDRMPLVPRFRGAEWWPLVRDTLPYAAATAVYTLYFRVTIVLMSLIASPRQTGYFATPFRVVEVFVGFPLFAIGAAFPILSRAAASDAPRFRYVTGRVLELALISGVAVALMLVLGAPFVVDLLAGSAGRPAARVLQVQALALIGTFLVVATSYPLLALRRHMALLVANALALAMNVALTLVLVPVDGARGAATAAVVAEICLAAMQLAALTKARGRAFRISALPVVTIAGGLAITPLLVPGLHPLLRVMAGSLIYLIAITVMGRFPPEVADALRRRRA